MNAWERKGCGTDAGYQWHRRNEGTPVRCTRCRKANARRVAGQDREKANARARDRYALLRIIGCSAAEADKLKWLSEERFTLALRERVNRHERDYARPSEAGV